MNTDFATLDKLVRQAVREELAALNPQRDSETILSPAQACTLLGISKPTLHKLAKQGRIPSYRMGRRVGYRQSEVLKALENYRRFSRG